MLINIIIICSLCAVVRSQSTPCKTPNGEETQCIPLQSCFILRTAVVEGDNDEKEFVAASFCGADSVCCGTETKFAKKVPVTTEAATEKTTTAVLIDIEAEKKTKRDYALKHLLPSKVACGMQHYDDYYHFDNETNATSVDEFPWLMFTFVLNQTSRLVYHTCVGSLLNIRYGITAGFCGKNETLWATVGHYQSFKPGGSCTPTQYGDYCTGSVRDVRVEEQIKSPDGTILLIRFDYLLTYSDFLRPVCLPIVDSMQVQPGETGRAMNGSVVFTSGWADSLNGKKKLGHVITQKSECSITGAKASDCFYAVTLGNGTGSLGDSDGGGPVMFSYRGNWLMEGIVYYYSKSPQNLHARLIGPKDIDWILENMRD